MKDITIIEEPIGPESIQEIITRQYEPLEDPPAPRGPVMISPRGYGDLKRQIQEAEKDLFQMKARFALLRPPMGRPTLQAPNPYRCVTCHNIRCLNHGLIKTDAPEGTIIANQTGMNGCLAWLPEVIS